jgi:Ribonuclease HII
MEEELFLFDMPEYRVICGADEAGRGPLAGPVVAAAVVLPTGFPVDILNDSKKMTEKQRLEAEKVIREKATYSIVFISEKEIDEINILNASLKAMKLAYEEVSKELVCDILLVDGNKTPDVKGNVEAIVKGDAKVPEIMAASILAKTARDRYMEELDEKYPMYGFKINKGYPTAFHRNAIKEWGLSPVHRKTFRVKFDD